MAPNEVARLRRGPTLRERQAMGVTLVNVTRIARDLKSRGEIEGETAGSLAPVVLGVLVDENPETFSPNCKAIDWAAIDWDKILEFIERLLELILKFLPLFV